MLAVAVALVGCREEILHDLSEREANRVLTALDDARLRGRKERQPDGRWAISVRSQDQLNALVAVERTPGIRERAAPQEEGTSLLSPREYQHFSLERRLSRELEETLITLDGVVEARVHLNLPLVESNLARSASRNPVSAGVVLVVDSGVQVERETVARVVAGASGIAPSSVSVLLVNAPQRTRPIGNHHAASPSSPAPIDHRLAPLVLLVVLLFIAAAVVRRCWFVLTLDRNAVDKPRLSEGEPQRAAGVA